MTSFAASSLRRLAGLFRHAAEVSPPSPGSAVVLDGLSAVAFTEASVADSAGLAAGYPASIAARVWSRRSGEHALGALGQPLGGVEAESARGALAAAIGMASSGERAVAFCSGPDLATAGDLLAQASGQRLPLVVHLACRAGAGHAQALGSGHEAFVAAGDKGFLQFFARNVQEAVDFALIARRVSERALVPALVAMDGEQTATAVQDVRLPDEALLRAFVGESSRHIDTPTEAQRLIFGDTRRPVPRLFDLERPMLLSPLQGPESWAFGAAGARPFFDDHVPALLAEAFDLFAQQTGRRRASLVEHRLEDAAIKLVAQGSAVETAAALADWARRVLHLKVGVLGVCCLRPFPGAAIAGALRGDGVVAVLERCDTAHGAEAALTGELRAALQRGRENSRFGAETHPGYPSLADKEIPRLVTVPYGLGGLPLRASDLAALLEELRAPKRSRVYLGLDSNASAGAHPKRQVLADHLRRSYPQLDSLGLRGRGAPPDLRPPRATSLALVRLAGSGHESLAATAAALLHEVAGGAVRSRAALGWQQFGEQCAERVIHSPAATATSGVLGDPGDDGLVDIAVLGDAGVRPTTDFAAGLAPGAVVLATRDTAPLAESMLSARKGGRSDGDIRLYVVDVEGDPKGEPWLHDEALLGGIGRLFLGRPAAAGLTDSKMCAAREALLEELPEPQRERRLQVFRAALASVHLVEETSVVAPPQWPREHEAPLAVRHLARSDERQDSLPRFWGQVGVLYGSGSAADLSIDPYLAMGAVPPLSSALREVVSAAALLPAFDPKTCDGNGRLWTTCPDGSVAGLAISPRALVDAGINLASARGKAADALRRIAGKLAKRASKIVKEGEGFGLASELLMTAYADVCGDSGADAALDASTDAALDASTDAALDAAMEAVVAEVGALPLARTEVFFDAAERAAAGTGELFTLVVNPDSCKSPELLLSACEGRGLTAVEKTPESVEAARRLWNLCQQLPDTSGATIRRVAGTSEVGPLAAMLLSRHCSQAMAGGDGAEPASGAKLALRWVLAATEYHQQPIVQRQLSQIDELRQRLAERLRSLLADALPTSDLDALSEGLDLLGRGDVDLVELSGKVDRVVEGGKVDGARLGRIVDVARGLADLHWHLTKGPAGLGRARAGIAIAPGSAASWTAVFPYNPFQSPAVVDASGETAQLASGLLEGQVRQALAGLRLMRWARLELDHPDSAEREGAGLSQLRFVDLTEEERRLCAPVLVIGDGAAFGGRAAAQLAWLLDSKLPVKIVVLSEIGGQADGALGVDALGSYPPARRFDVGLLGLLSRKAFVVQTSAAEPAHFADGVERALAFDGPALIHVHAPSPQRHGFETTALFERARAAVDSRAFPLFVFDPSRAGVFGSRLEISSNPQPASRWVVGAAGAMTPVDWALGERRFAHCFSPLAGTDPAPTPLAEYLELAPAERSDRTPFVVAPDGAAERRLRVAPVLVADADERGRLWQTLQELGGVVTPFTGQVRDEARSEVAKAHSAEIAALRSEYEARIAQLRAEFELDARRRVTRGLMALAGYPRDSRNPEVGA